jgi:CheY-like chemotaxis protein
VSNRICLIVDDEPDIRTLLSVILKRHGVQTVEAANAPEALDIIRKLEGRLDLIMMDFHMPDDMDGVDLAHSIREQFPDIPVILITGYGDEPKILSSGFPVIRKPFLPETFWKVVAKMMAKGGYRPLD